ncbi:MAG TPA: SpoIIIAC/SpoIIIAD family protein [Clostridiales bacterium]|jgi:stage III sporulation protein AC|nr:SpoIIIAC/SpoIIIAD family protein [Clostridiales bacterium]
MGDFGIIFFLAGLAIAVTVIHLLLKQAGREEYAYLTLFLGITIALIKVIPYIVELFEKVESVMYFY